MTVNRDGVGQSHTTMLSNVAPEPTRTRDGTTTADLLSINGMWKSMNYLQVPDITSYRSLGPQLTGPRLRAPQENICIEFIFEHFVMLKGLFLVHSSRRKKLGLQKCRQSRPERYVSYSEHVVSIGTHVHGGDCLSSSSLY